MAMSSGRVLCGGGGGHRGKRTIWSTEECIARAKAWISVVEDPYIRANQHIDWMWWHISQSYLQFKPPGGNPYHGEECRKQWERLRWQLSHFAGCYTNCLCMASSGMYAEDLKLAAHQRFIDPSKGFSEFKYWDVYLVVQDSPKFTAGIESGWPKRKRISESGEYSSSAGSFELPPTETEFPTPTSSNRRRRPIGQKAVAATPGGSGSGSTEAQSAAPTQSDPDNPLRPHRRK